MPKPLSPACGRFSRGSTRSHPALRSRPDEAHLTVAPVRYDLARRAARRRRIRSSRRLAASRMRRLPVYVQSNPHFRLPARRRADHHDRRRHRRRALPRLHAGAGGARRIGGRSWLFFGERNFRTDFLYQIEWQGLLKDGVLTRMDVAFSRDGSGRKIYVQHRLRERPAMFLPGSRRARISMSAAMPRSWRPMSMRR